MQMNRARYHFDNVYGELRRIVGPYLLYQVGDLSCEAGYEVLSHVQQVHEITYVVSGSGACITNGVTYPLEKGMLFLNAEGETHALRSSSADPMRYFYLGFTFQTPDASDAMRQMCDFYGRPEPHAFAGVTGVQEPFIRLLSEVITCDALSDSLIACAMHQIITYVYRLHCRHVYCAYGMNEDKSADEKLVYDVIHYIDSEVEHIGSLHALSPLFGYSYTHIAQKFSNLTGESLMQYYTKRRFEKAQENIRRGLQITAVAETMGYQSIHAFSRAFKRQVGMTPRDFRKWA
ncbi:MAG: AraC family transcriptional regulator, partial [Clostridia bacterium]